MMRYESPKYEMEKISVSDVVTVSVIKDENNLGDWVNQVSEILDKAATK